VLVDPKPAETRVEPIMSKFVGTNEALPWIVKPFMDYDIPAPQFPHVEATCTSAEVAKPNSDIEALGKLERVIGLVSSDQLSN
jgi:hypothetical protein